MQWLAVVHEVQGTAEGKAGADGGRVATRNRTSTGPRSHIYTTDFVGEKTDNMQICIVHLGYIFLFPMGYTREMVKR